MKRIITLTTDFGTQDGYVGSMRGVILSINPDVTLVDISHEIAPQEVEEGAFVLAASAKFFPADAIHVVVVDPGVGSARRAIAVQAGETIFVAPDNGVLTREIERLRDREIRVVQLSNPEFFLPHVSRTFHGRDIFAPVAAHLSLGTPLEFMGASISDWVRLPRVLPSRRGTRSWVGRVEYVDRFGNAVTNISAEWLAQADPRMIVVDIGGKKIVGLKRAYADGAEGELIAVIGSDWALEVAQCNGNASKTLGISRGAEVVVSV